MRRTFAASLLAMTIALGAGASRPDTPAHHKPVLTMNDAQRALDAAIDRANTGARTGAIAIVDDGGALLLFSRLDDTFPAGAEVSIGKARTAATFRKPTKFFEDAVKSGRTPLLDAPGMTPLQGGVPILIDGQVVGAIGVSGAASADEDEQIALAGANSLAPTPTESGATTTQAHH